MATVENLYSKHSCSKLLIAYFIYFGIDVLLGVYFVGHDKELTDFGKRVFVVQLQKLPKKTKKLVISAQINANYDQLQCDYRVIT